jgi:hypothetical protein
MHCKLFHSLTFCSYPKGGDFYHYTSTEALHFNYTKNCHTKHCTPAFAKMLLADALPSTVSLNGYLSIVLAPSQVV